MVKEAPVAKIKESYCYNKWKKIKMFFSNLIFDFLITFLLFLKGETFFLLKNTTLVISSMCVRQTVVN